jgi:hypothetical protein
MLMSALGFAAIGTPSHVRGGSEPRRQQPLKALPRIASSRPLAGISAALRWQYLKIHEFRHVSKPGLIA